MLAQKLIEDYDFTPTDAAKLIEKRTAIVEHGQALRSFDYYIAVQLVRAETENWPLDRDH